MTTLENIDQIHQLISEDRRISAKSIAEQLGISRERVGSIIHEDLGMRKRRQSNNQWSGGIAAHHAPKNSECKLRWKRSAAETWLDCKLLIFF